VYTYPCAFWIQFLWPLLKKLISARVCGRLDKSLVTPKLFSVLPGGESLEEMFC
jgi:hypothetical protein